MPSALSFRYARALTDVVTAPGAPAAADPKIITGQLTEFADLMKVNSELAILFSTPAVSTAKKTAVLSELSKSLNLAPLTKNFLTVVLQHERMDWLQEIVEAFNTLLDERLGVVVAEITSARTLEEKDRQALTEALSRRTGKQVKMRFALDPALIGGVTARVGSTIYDGSVRGQLDRLRTDLLND